MSEDSAHGQHFEPSGNGQAGPAVPAPLPSITTEELLEQQAKRVQELGVRVHSLLLSAIETYDEFITESFGFFKVLSLREEQQNANRPTDATTTQASA